MWYEYSRRLVIWGQALLGGSVGTLLTLADYLAASTYCWWRETGADSVENPGNCTAMATGAWRLCVVMPAWAISRPRLHYRNSGDRGPLYNLGQASHICSPVASLWSTLSIGRVTAA
jgi:hypothetical protein